MKAQGSLQQAIRAGCMLIFLAGCAAYGSRLAIQPAELPPKSVQAMLPVRGLSVTQVITGTPTHTPTASPTSTPTRTHHPSITVPPTKQKPPGIVKKTRTPTPHIPPGLAKKTGTPTRTHLPPGQVKKTPTATNTPSPVLTWTGSVLIQGGAWGLAGCVGETINIKVEFEASSPFGQVEEMKVLRSDDWEPFVPVKYYPHTFGPNWYSWGITVEYRDEHGNISPVYQDDISMEGWCYFTATPPITGTP